MIGKITLMLHWYCKATYNLGQFFSLKRQTVWDGGSTKKGQFGNINTQNRQINCINNFS